MRSSTSMMFLITSFVPSEAVKNIENGMTWPAGSSTNFPAVARLTVDSCIPIRSPTSARVSGRRLWTPFSRKSRWHSTMTAVIRAIVCRRWLMLSMKNFARVTYSRMCWRSLSSICGASVPAARAAWSWPTSWR